MNPDSKPPVRAGLQLLPKVQFTGDGNNTIAGAALRTILPLIYATNVAFKLQSDACACKGHHTAVVDVGKTKFENLGRLFFLVGNTTCHH